MLARLFSSMWRLFTWCFLASICIACIESFGYFSLRGADTSLPFGDFARLFANTCGIMLAATLAAWLLVRFFMVWLGGVRPGLALFFLLAFFILFDYLVVVLDVPSSQSAKVAADWARYMTMFFWAALILVTLMSLILAKVSRKWRPLNPTPRVFTIITVVFMGAAFAYWARNARFPGTQGGLFWGAFAVVALLAAVLLWWFGRSPRRLAVVSAILAAVIFWPLAEPYFNPPAPQIAARPAGTQGHAVKHILLITIDTLRQDGLGVYDAGAVDNSPHMDQLAREGVMFTNSFSSSPWTYPSVATILTGLSPRVHQLTDGKNALPDGVPTMAEALEKAGYRTGSRGHNSLMLPRSRLNRGFQDYLWFPQERMQVPNFQAGLAHNLLAYFGQDRPDATGLTDQAIQWHKDNAQHDSFFWIHYFSPHMPYMPPEKYQSRDPAQRSMGVAFDDVRSARMGSIIRTAKERAWVRELYDGEVRYVDAEIGRLLDSLRDLGIYDDTLIILTSDHGEEFWDHDLFEHGHSLYNELVRVPLLIKAPNASKGTTVEMFVSGQAIMPTVLDLCGVTPEAGGILVPSLAPLLRDPAAAYAGPPISIGASLFHDAMEGVIFDGMKYVQMDPSGHELLFNLQSDPGERNSLAVQDPVNLERGRQLLNEGRTSDAGLTGQLGIRKGEENSLSPEAVQSLQDLGYL